MLPEALCDRLSDVDPDAKAWVARIAPEFAQVPVRAFPDTMALDVFGRAAAAGWGSFDVLTDDVFREPCTVHFSRRALRAVDAAFELNLPLPIRARDTDGEDFEMTALLIGRGSLAVFYDRDAIVYWNEDHGRELTLASRIDLDTPVAGTFENVEGLCADVFLFGCLRVHSMVKAADGVEVRAGSLRSRSPLRPIQARDLAAKANGGG